MSISIGMNILDKSNWAGFVREVTQGNSGLRPLLKRQYLSALGGVLASFESMQSAAPALARRLALEALAPTSSAQVRDPALHPLRIEIPTA